MNEHTNDAAAIDQLAADYQRLKTEIGKVIVGQDEVVKLVLMSIFSDGHSLLVGVPGLAKTLLIKTISDVLELSFKRVQFTPDLMPSD
jgi:MoxR-like ATPase